MCPSSDEQPKIEEAAAAAASGEPKPVIAADAAVSAEPPKQGPICWRPPVLVYTAFSLMTIVFVLFILYSWSGYSDKYAQVTEGWSIGNTKMIEITLVRDDKEGLACSSNLDFGGVRCGYAANGTPLGDKGPSPSQLLQPFNTVKNELFLGAGLWASKGLPKTLPTERFTVVCNYRVIGVARSMALRWGQKASFDPLKHSAAVGTLNDCVIPQ
jgi:hypothetical protein